MSTSATVRALQAALAAEQAASYGYGVVGAHLDFASLARAQTDWTAHEKAADQLSALLRGRGVTPAPAAVAYDLPHHVTTSAQATALAVALEDQVTSAYLALVALPDSSLRLLGARQARAAALRAAAWRTTTVAFPGLPAAALRASTPTRTARPATKSATPASQPPAS
jgi:hypothetical protein